MKFLLCFASLCLVLGNEITPHTFTPNVGIVQPDAQLHTMVKLSTSALATECANYCAHRGSLFRYVHKNLERVELKILLLGTLNAVPFLSPIQPIAIWFQRPIKI